MKQSKQQLVPKEVFANTSRILDAWLPRKISFDHIPAISVGISYKGKIIYARGFGYADVATKKEATAETCYRIASQSKMFTAVAVLQLHERGRLQLNNRVKTYLPWFPNNRITIKDLLTHGAGIWRDGDTPHWATNKFPDIARLRHIISKEMYSLPRNKQFKYSNFGYALIGEIIKKVSGLPYERYVTANILQPLRLKHTWPDTSTTALQHLGTGYSNYTLGKQKAFGHPQTKSYAPATGFISNASDLLVFLRALSPKNNLLLSKNLKQQMARKHHKTPPYLEWYGLGLEIFPVQKRMTIGHGGNFLGFTTKSLFDSRNDLAVAVLTNMTNSSGQDIAKGVLEVIYGQLDHHARYARLKSPPHPSRFEGCFINDWGEVCTVALQKGLVAFSTGSKSPLSTKSLLSYQKRNEFLLDEDNSFSYHNELVRFTANKARRITGFVWGATPSKKVE